MGPPRSIPQEPTLSSDADYRLPRTVIPSHYQLTLEPDLDTFTFRGSEVVTVIVHQPVESIVLNAVDLEIDRAELIGVDPDRRIAATVRFDEAAERATFDLSGTAEPGEWELHVEFRGELNDKLHGFYRSSYEGPDGETKVIATTQFEATDARRAFPCWDEPDLKATFGVTLVVPDAMTAISNAAAIANEPVGDGKRRVRFADTMRMSTYLVAFVVGDFEATDPVDVDGVPLRIVYPPGKGHLTPFALEVGAHSLRYFTGYYGIPYPGDKVDMIAIPDFAWGAMENLGAITYRETALLVDPKRATQLELQRVAAVIAHELAHMWFGDLVTMKWWNGIWLNEAFATFMENKAVDDFKPEWNLWLSFGDDRGDAMDVDALHATRPIEFPVASPEEANAMFDTLTYDKGSAVLRMLEQYLGEGTFRAGVADYLRKHAYGNTETADLWDALEAASSEPVRDIMESWILQGGFPRLTVTRDDDGYRIEQEQFRYLGEGAHRWIIPVMYRNDSGTGRVLVDDAARLEGDDLVVNAGGTGFYRTWYEHDLLHDLASRVSDLQAGERYALVADTWAGVLAGDTPAADYLDLVAHLRDETEPVVWGLVLAGLAELDRIVSSDDRSRLQAFTRRLLGPTVDRLGWEPGPGEGDLTRRLRGSILAAMAVLGDDRAVKDAAGEVFDRYVADPAGIDGNVANAVLSIAAADGGMAEFEQLWDLHKAADTPQDRVRYLRAASGVPDVAAARRLFEAVIGGQVPRQDAAWVLARLLGGRDHGAAVWGWMKDQWDEVLAAGPPQATRNLFLSLHHRSEPDVAADITAWLNDHPVRGAEQHVSQHLERLHVRVGLRERESTRLGDGIPGLG